MPLKGEAKRIAQKRWREGSTPAYHRWLYARRKLRVDNAENFRLAIEEAVLIDDLDEIHELLDAALEEADRREREVGNRFEHLKDRPYYLEEEGEA